MSVTFTISTDEPDRYGDVVDQKSWDFESYINNNLVLWGHDPSEPENVLGNGPDTLTGFKTYKQGGVTKTDATLTFDKDNPKASFVFGQIMRGVLKTVSVGFRNHSMEWDEDTPVLKDNELLEISVVPIPANKGAVAKELKAGGINEKDARWLMESMRKEADLMDAHIKSSTKEKSMTEEQATALLASITNLTEKVDTLTTDNQTLREELAALKPAEETPEEKTAREAAEAKAQEDANVAAGLNPDGSAKSGSDDQDGAEADELDLDAELTPEQEAEAREALRLPVLESAA